MSLNLNEGSFDRLPKHHYLELLGIIANSSATESERLQAKESLLNSQMRVISWAIHRALQGNVQIGTGNALGIEDFSDLLNSAAGSIFREFTKIAVAQQEKGFSLSTAIVLRATRRVFDKIRKLKAAKNHANFEPMDGINDFVDKSAPFEYLEELITVESMAQLRRAVDLLEGTERDVALAMIYGTETNQNLTVAEVADSLGIPKSTARSAWQRACKRLSQFLANENDGD